MRSLVWQNPSPNLTLLNDEIHLWRANLNLSPQHIEQLETTLSEDEQLRANRFRFPNHRRRFVAARGILRQLLGFYLQTSGDIVSFTYNLKGKPQLAPDFSNTNLEFNISHSQDLALYSFNRDQIIGIDLEYLRDNVDYENIAQRFFCQREFNLITTCPKQQQLARFYQLWTAKEAYLKATGEGLAGGLETLEINFDSAGNIYLYKIKNQKNLAHQWSLYNFIPETNFIATIALSGKEKKLTAINYV
ncbi:MAG: 4'-phosphopantetheinyl transferase superfamily protein [Xenococcaceae cyanobacterium MO_207.B15]|nr:4'-phosphopantetheinyl transferase superfamily protein [Xenococcaceae cyanobacterium MO_207.B15]MDJ0747263.1 4'-phosphopantetheinyl transferase superfamily protein [Xenococcaceae cyanobacterium MO_167.B27]